MKPNKPITPAMGQINPVKDLGSLSVSSLSSTGPEVTGESTLLSSEIDVLLIPESGVAAVEVTAGLSTAELTPNKGGIVFRSASVSWTRVTVPPQLDLIRLYTFSLIYR